MTTTTLTAPAATVSTDHEISVETAASRIGEPGQPLKPATVRRYLAAGKLVRLGNGISADSVEAYRIRRDAGRAKFAANRFKKAAAYTEIEQALADYAEALALAAKARKIMERVGDTVKALEAGRHGRFELTFTNGRKIKDDKQIKADYKARGEELPMTLSAPSPKIRRVA